MSEIVRRSSRRARNPVDYNPRPPRVMPYGNSAAAQRRHRARQREQEQALAVALADGPIQIDENAPLTLVCRVFSFSKYFYYIFTNFPYSIYYF